MIDYARQIQIIEENEISDNLKVLISVAFDETKVFLNVDYMDGKFTLQKSFLNNYIGLEQLEEARKDFNTEEKIKKYFNIQE